MNKLPDKVGDLIRIAIKDLQVCEADDKYIIDMEKWHTPKNLAVGESGPDSCYVCLAGSVMAQTLDVPRDQRYVPDLLPTEDLDARLRLLDILRYARTDLYYINQINFPDLSNVDEFRYSRDLFDATQYRVDPEQFKIDMLKIAELADTYDLHFIRD